jgi:hypothetical protein
MTASLEIPAMVSWRVAELLWLKQSNIRAAMQLS